MKIEIEDDAEDYCSDCGCAADDEICPRCRAKIAYDEMFRVGREGRAAHGDRRWNGQAMSRAKAGDDGMDETILVNIRETPDSIFHENAES